MKTILKSSLLAGVVLVVTAGIALASFGVGLSAPRRYELGKIKPNEEIHLGQVAVFNMGDEYGCYKMGVSSLTDQPEKRVPKEWVTYTPEEFCLDPYDPTRDYQLVAIDVKVIPKIRLDKGLKGDYFSFLEACTYQGSFGACAATKLFFSI